MQPTRCMAAFVAAGPAGQGASARKGPRAVKSRSPPLRAARVTPAQAPAAADAEAPPALQDAPAVASTPVALPAALQGTLLPNEAKQSSQMRKRQGGKPAVAGPEANAANLGQQPTLAGPANIKRRDRRRRQLAKQRAELAAAAAVAAAATAALTDGLTSTSPAAVDEQHQGVAQEGRKQRQQRPRRAPQPTAEATDGDAAASGSQGGKVRTWERQIPITPKEEGLLRWYADVAAAAEQAHKAAPRTPVPGRKQRGGQAAAAAATLAESLQAPIQGWLDERLEYMGFEGRQFPALRPLDATWRAQQAQRAQQQRAASGLLREQQEGGEHAYAEIGNASSSSSTTSSSSSSSGSSSTRARKLRGPRRCTTATFARWAQAAGGELPLLASQWHRAAATWELGGGTGRWLHEAHAAHEWSGAAEEHAQAMIGLYEEFAREAAGLPVVAGRAPASATLRGAAVTYTLQALAGQGHALEVATAHHLSDNYARLLLGRRRDEHALAAAGEEDEEEGRRQSYGNEEEGDEDGFFFSQMGSGLQASILGGVALAHGDDAGLRLPPALAPVQVLIVPLQHYRCGKGEMVAEAQRLRAVLEEAGVRVEVDGRRRGPAGVRFGDSERRGVPLRIELGPRDLKSRTCVIAQRHVPGRGAKLAGVSTDPDSLVDTVHSLLDDAQADFRWSAAAALEECIVDVSSFYELREVVEAGKWARGPWAGSLEDEAAVRDETGASLLCFPLAQPVSMWGGFNTCMYSGYQAAEVALFGRTL